jgi:two-component system sensor histidine kinase PilS (NtrC family)
VVPNIDAAFALQLRSFFLKCTAARLGIVTVCLLTVIAEWLHLSVREMVFIPQRQLLYGIFFFFGFGANIVYLFLQRWFLHEHWFFSSQIVIDIILSIFWIFLTGLTFSPFLFIIFIMIFYYGKFHGIQTSIIISFVFIFSLFFLSCFQFYFPYYWSEEHIRGSYIAYNFCMLCVGFLLVNGLVRIQKHGELEILRRLHERDMALKKAEDLQRKVFHGLDTSLVLLDPYGRITSLNAAAMAEVGGHGSVIEGKSLVEVFPEFAPFWQERFRLPVRNIVHSLARGKVYGFRLSPLGEDGWILLFSDITEIQRLERQVQEMERLVAVADLAAGLAHEMKNPLAGIKASLQLFMAGDLEEAHRRRLAHVVVRDVDRLDALVHDFLVFARPSDPCLEEIALVPFLREMAETIRLRYPRVEVILQVTDAVWVFDRTHLHHIVSNVLTNACQAVDTKSDPPRQVVVENTEGPEAQSLAVRDTGPGMTADMLRRCFDPFVTTKPQGTGLGLAISRRLAAQNGALLEVAANSDVGVTFTLTRPRTS